jgi:hypothetical protein
MLHAVPMTQREANEFVAVFHRHNLPPRGALFQVGASDGERLVGVALVGRPVARLLQNGATAEVLRCCVIDDAPKGTCSFLYGACWRAAKALGWRKLITYTLQSESGASMRGAGWRLVGEAAKAPAEGWSRDGRERRWQDIYGQQKLRWEAASA